MTLEFDPQKPEESDGGVTSASAAEQLRLNADRERGQGINHKVGDLSDLNRHDQRLVDDFLGTLR